MWYKHWPEFMYICQWSIFHSPVILPYILKTICWTNAIIGILEINVVLEILIQCDTNIELKLYNYYVSHWPIFHGPVILLYILKTIWWKNVIIGIVDPCDAKICQMKCMWVSDLYFMVQCFCLISWKSVWWTNVVVGILDLCDTKINHIKCMWVSDIHIVVQWF